MHSPIPPDSSGRDILHKDRTGNLSAYRRGSTNWRVSTEDAEWSVNFVATHFEKEAKNETAVPAP
eukprot:4298682-Amphidinium_carterae.1